MQLAEHVESVKKVADVISISTIFATFLGALPHVAAFLSIVWTILRIMETEKYKEWRKKRRSRR